MNIDDFIDNLDEVLKDLEDGKDSFRRNMINEGLKEEDKPFSTWLHMFLSWSEVAYEEDIKRYYWYLDEE